MKTYILDAEFGEGPKGLPTVRCFVLYSVQTQTYDYFGPKELSELKTHEAFRPANRIVAYYALAELQSLKALGIQVFSYVIDLFLIVKTEIPLEKLTSYSLISVCAYFGIPTISDSNKDIMRDLALRGEPYSAQEQNNLIEYCKSDVEITYKLFEKLEYLIHDPTYIWGEYLKLCCEIQYRGIPVKIHELNFVLRQREKIKNEILSSNDLAKKIYVGDKFNTNNFRNYLKTNQIAWFYTSMNKLDLSDDAFNKMKTEDPNIYQLGRIRKYLSSLRQTKLKVENDGRIYSPLGPFGSLTGRNQPPGSKHILLHPSFFRGFISPTENNAIIYIDYTQQEFGIAASLSKDEAMMNAYSSGDPYLYFAKLVGAAPSSATKSTHPVIRSMYKQAILAVQYGMGPQSLAIQIDSTEIQAKRLLADHERAFPTFWKWIRNYIDQSNLRGFCKTKWGWKLPLGRDVKTRTIANFPMQAGGSEILRQALFLLDEHNIKTIAPLHDAVLIECQINEVTEINDLACKLLVQASRDYLDGFSLGVDSKIINTGERFPIEKDPQTWQIIYSEISKGVYNGNP